MSPRRLLLIGMLAFLGAACSPDSVTDSARTGQIISNWRYAEEHETADVWIKGPCPWQVGDGECERGSAPWRMGPDGEKKSSAIGWVRLEGTQLWMPARTDVELGRTVVYDGMSVSMPSVPGGGHNLGFIRRMP